MRRMLVIAAVFLAGWCGAAEPLSQFSADQIMKVSGKVITSSLYVDGSNLRTEMNIPGAPPMTSIVNGSKKVVWMLMPGNLYMEHSIGAEDDAAVNAWVGGKDNRELLGTEDVNGQKCEKYKVKGASHDVFLYTDIKTGFPVLMEVPSQSVRVEWKNVKPGPQAASLFQLPSGSQKMALPQLPGGFKLPGMK